MEIKQSENTTKGKFFVEENNKEIGALHYVYAGETKLIIDHTEVLVANEGHGIGKQLVNAVVNFARKKGIKIIPLCPYAKSIFERVPEYRDVLI